MTLHDMLEATQKALALATPIAIGGNPTIGVALEVSSLMASVVAQLTAPGGAFHNDGVPIEIDDLGNDLEAMMTKAKQALAE